nr:immunoglobulin heavy chain junction region [Macaca mulatta]
CAGVKFVYAPLDVW